MAGHSKWAQIKHKKSVTDAKRGALFSKMAREIMVAAKTGGDPDINARLRTAIERARANGLPKDNIERAIERGTGGGEARDLQEFMYEATCPGGVSILIEGITDNKNRTFAEIRHIVTKYGGKMADPGSVAWNFEKLGTLEVLFADNAQKPKEEIEFAIIESGAKDFKAAEDRWFIETDFILRDKIRQELSGRGIVISQSGHEYGARNVLHVPEERKKELEPLLEELTEHPDVQEAYTNLEAH